VAIALLAVAPVKLEVALIFRGGVHQKLPFGVLLLVFVGFRTPVVGDKILSNTQLLAASTVAVPTVIPATLIAFGQDPSVARLMPSI
jgi:hypothetical protein